VKVDEPTRDQGRRSGGGGQLRVVHVIAGLDVAHGGPSYSVPRLCAALAVAGVETALLSVAFADRSGCDASENGYSDHRYTADYAQVPILRDLRRSRGLSAALKSAAQTADVIHNHGFWLMPNVEAGWAAVRAGKPLVVSPRGMLAPAALAFSRRKKRTFWRLLQGPAIRRAACLHATSEQEYQEIRAFGLNNPVAVIPNGIDVPESLTEPDAGAQAERVVLSL
jgi:hypothetical protein